MIAKLVLAVWRALWARVPRSPRALALVRRIPNGFREPSVVEDQGIVWGHRRIRLSDGETYERTHNGIWMRRASWERARWDLQEFLNEYTEPKPPLES